MGFYIRKAISSGPFRFNLSRSGLGLSVGIKRFRIGTGPRGNYVHMGRHGLYYRTSLGGARYPVRTTDISRQPPTSPAELGQTVASPLTAVETSDVLEMKPASPSDIVAQINQKLAAMRTWPWALGVGVHSDAMSDEARRLERDKPPFWEYELTVELLRLWACPFVDKWNELKRGGYTTPALVVPQDQIGTRCQDRFHDVSRYCETFGRLMSRELPASWGPHGQPGSPERIKAVCKQVADLAQAILARALACLVRGGAPPGAARRPTTLCPGA